MDDVFCALSVFWLYFFLISSHITQNEAYEHELIGSINGQKKVYTITKTECSSNEFKSDLYTDVNTYQLKDEGKTQHYVNFTWRQERSFIFVTFIYAVNIKGSDGSHECCLIEFEQSPIPDLNNVYMLEVNFLPTELVQINSIGIFFQKRKFVPRNSVAINSVTVQYSQNKSELVINIPKIKAPLYNLTIFKNPDEKCISGEMKMSFNVNRDYTSDRTFRITLEPEEGLFCVCIRPERSCEAMSDHFTLTGEDDFPKANCTFQAPISKWNASMEIIADYANRSAKLVFALIARSQYTCLKEYKVELCDSMSSTLCKTSEKGCKYSTVNDTFFDHTFTNLDEGNYCARVYPICQACTDRDNLIRYSKTVLLLPNISPTIKDIPVIGITESAPQLPIALSVIAGIIVIIIVLLVLLLYYYYRRRTHFYNDPESLNNIQSIEDIICKVNENCKKNRRKVMLVPVIINQTLHKAVAEFSQVLKTNYFCEVVIMNPSTVRKGCSKSRFTSQPDWISNTMKQCNKVIFIKPIKDLETTLKASSDAEAIFYCCRENILAGWNTKKWSSENVAVVDLSINNENTFKVLKNNYVHTFSLPSYFAHLFGFIHDVNGEVTNETLFQNYWLSINDFTLANFKVFLEKCNKTII